MTTNLSNKVNKLCGRLSRLEKKKCDCPECDCPEEIKLLLSSTGNQQMLGFGSPTATVAYFGLTTSPPDSPILMPGMTNVLNKGGFIENTTYSQSGPSPVRGAPGWQVPVAGLYKLSVSTTVAAGVSNTDPAAPDFCGFNGVLNSAFNATLMYAVNNSGVIYNTITDASRFWSALPNESYISYPLTGFVFVNLIPSDVLFCGIITNHRNSGMQLEQSTFELEYVRA